MIRVFVLCIPVVSTVLLCLFFLFFLLRFSYVLAGLSAFGDATHSGLPFGPSFKAHQKPKETQRRPHPKTTNKAETARIAVVPCDFPLKNANNHKKRRSKNTRKQRPRPSPKATTQTTKDFATAALAVLWSAAFAARTSRRAARQATVRVRERCDASDGVVWGGKPRSRKDEHYGGWWRNPFGTTETMEFDDFPVNSNKEWFPMVSIRCRILSIHSSSRPTALY